MIKNIWAHLDKIVWYFKTKSSIVAKFPWGIHAGRPITQPAWGMYLYFMLENNSPKISSDNYWTYSKTWLFNFYIIWNNKSLADVELYEALDLLSNNIITFWKEKIKLDGFDIFSIQEWNQSWVLRDKKENPYIICQYEVIYKYLYSE